jgi:acetyl-CoA synthetase
MNPSKEPRSISSAWEFIENQFSKHQLLTTELRNEITLAKSTGNILSPQDLWQWLVHQRLSKNIQTPFALDAEIFQTLAKMSTSPSTFPAWVPGKLDLEKSNLSCLLKKLQLPNYEELYSYSLHHREAFWEQILSQLEIVFQDRGSQTYDEIQGPEKNAWWPDSTFNIAESCLQGAADSPAVLWQKEGTSHIQQWTYKELDTWSQKIAHSLLALGRQPGDRIAIDMPMTAEAVAIYLGIVRMGAVVVSIADSFAPQEIATRLRLSEAEMVFTQDHIVRGGKSIPLYQRVTQAEAPQTVVLSSDITSPPDVGLRPEDLTWQDFLIPNPAPLTFHRCSPDTELNILFSSGTTGDPKAIPWTHLTPIKCAMDGYLHQDIHKGERVAWPTNLGWMMGPWLIFASLINKGTICLYEGLPTSGEFGDFVARAKVNVLGIVPSIVKAWRATSCMEGKDWSSLRLFSSTGEASSPEDYLYLMSLANYRPVIEYCGGTEIGGAYLTSTVLQANAPSTFSTPALGLKLLLLDSHRVPADQGEVFIQGPSPGLSNRLLNANHNKIYYFETPIHDGQPLRRHGDELRRWTNGYWQALGRVDDTMNLGGIKVSSAEIERCLNTASDVMETAAIAVSPSHGGPSELVICIVPSNPEAMLNIENFRLILQKKLSKELNPLFKIHRLHFVDKLPRTASNKIMRRVLRDQLSFLAQQRPPL